MEYISPEIFSAPSGGTTYQIQKLCRVWLGARKSTSLKLLKLVYFHVFFAREISLPFFSSPLLSSFPVCPLPLSSLSPSVRPSSPPFLPSPTPPFLPLSFRSLLIPSTVLPLSPTIPLPLPFFTFSVRPLPIPFRLPVFYRRVKIWDVCLSCRFCSDSAMLMVSGLTCIFSDRVEGLL